jgi:hypothetical protein
MPALPPIPGRYSRGNRHQNHSFATDGCPRDISRDESRTGVLPKLHVCQLQKGWQKAGEEAAATKCGGFANS